MVGFIGVKETFLTLEGNDASIALTAVFVRLTSVKQKTSKRDVVKARRSCSICLHVIGLLGHVVRLYSGSVTLKSRLTTEERVDY